MGIWIRTQDKEMIINCFAVGISLEDDKFICSNGYVLGKYSTKEKALKVLDMIETHLEELEYKIHNRDVIFQMPDDEVNKWKQ